MAHDRFGADAALLHQEMKIQQFAFAAAHTGFDKQPGWTEIAHAGDIAAGMRLPVNPHVVIDQDAGRSPAGGAGRGLRNTHRVHPNTADCVFPARRGPSENRPEILAEGSTRSQ